jgi:hypothetical protein
LLCSSIPRGSICDASKQARRLPVTNRAAPGETRVPWGKYHLLVGRGK